LDNQNERCAKLSRWNRHLRRPTKIVCARKLLRSRSVFISPARRLDRRRVYDDAGNVIETHEQAGDSKEW
jgi:hypothetical protein